MSKCYDFSALPAVAEGFFDKKAIELAPALLGKMLVRVLDDKYLGCRIIETEAYEYTDRASHSYRGRKGCEAMFAPAGTIYMYKIRQWHSINISSADYGGGVLIKGACPVYIGLSKTEKIPQTQKHNRQEIKKQIDRRFSGQGKLCQQLYLQTKEWNGKNFNDELYIAEDGYKPKEILITTRLGVVADKELPYRFVDKEHIAYATKTSIKDNRRNNH